jgi:hypothetical protein
MLALAPHSKHFFILTTAGKPVFSRHGPEAALSALAPVLGAVLSRAEDASDPLSSLALSDGTLLVVTTRGPFHLVALSRTGETLHALTQQLRLAWAYLLFATLPTVSLEASLRARPGADVRPQCAGVGPSMAALFRSFSRSPAVWLDAYPMVAMPTPALRARAGAALLTGAAQPLQVSLGGSDVGGGGGGDGGARVLYALILAGSGLVAWAAPPRSELALRPGDVQCLLAFLSSAGGALHRGGADAWVPIALPLLNSTSSVQAYVTRLALGERDAGAPLPAAAPPAPPPVSPSIFSALSPWASPKSPMSAPAGVVSPRPRAARLDFASPLALAAGARESRQLPDEGDGAGDGGEDVAADTLAQPQFDGEAPRHPPPPPAPAVTLVLIVAADKVGSAGGAAVPPRRPALPDAVSARAAAISRALIDSGVTASALRTVAGAHNVDGFCGGDLRADALWRELGLPKPPAPPHELALLHWLYLWKPTRQWIACAGWPAGMADAARPSHARRKALLRAYSTLYDAACAPPTRHAVSSLRPPAVPAAPVEAALPCITTLAAINTKYGLVLAAWGFGSLAAAVEQQQLPTDRIPGLMEKLAKALKAHQDRWFSAPAVLPGF